MKLTFQHWKIDTTTPVLVRIDGNVPHEEHVITDYFRLQRIRATLETLYQRGCPVILVTHVNRPKGDVDPKHSTAMIATWLSRHGYTVEHIPCDPNRTITTYMRHVKPRERTITVLDNIRFFPGEKSHDEHFVYELANSASYYINDAWGMMHRTDASVYAVAQQFAHTHRSYGHVVHQEIQALSQLRNKPQRPYVVFSGGAKIASKIPILEDLVDHELPDTIAVMPGIAGTFLRAQGYNVGASLWNKDYVDQARRIIEKAHARNIQIDIPDDAYIVRDAWDNELETVSIGNIPDNGIIIASGPETLSRYGMYTQQARTLFLNGPMGDIAYWHTIEPFKQLLRLIETSSAYTVVGGGDSVAIIHTLAIDPCDYSSTGGGSTLAYISRTHLPALDIL